MTVPNNCFKCRIICCSAKHCGRSPSRHRHRELPDGSAQRFARRRQ